MFANGPRDQGSIQGRVIPKTEKMVLDDSLLNIKRIKSKWINPIKRVAPFFTLRCSNYWKRDVGSPSSTVIQLMNRVLNIGDRAYIYIYVMIVYTNWWLSVTRQCNHQNQKAPTWWVSISTQFCGAWWKGDLVFTL